MSSTALKRRNSRMIVGEKMVRIALKEYLEEKGISIWWLHKETGIRYPTLHGYVNNKVDSINLNYLYVIMNALNINDVNLILKYPEDD